MLTLPNAIVPVLHPFATLFRNPTWRKAQILLVGAILAPGQRTVASALRVMGLSDDCNYARYHQVLNRAVWSPRQAARILLLLLQHPDQGDGPLVFGTSKIKTRLLTDTFQHTEPQTARQKPPSERKRTPKRATQVKPKAPEDTPIPKPKPAKEPKKARLTPGERKECRRARAARHRQVCKAQGLCRDRTQPTILGQTRCTTCAEKHRKSWRPRNRQTNTQP